MRVTLEVELDGHSNLGDAVQHVRWKMEDVIRRDEDAAKMSSAPAGTIRITKFRLTKANAK
jgi:hypothetical protein